MIYLWLIPILLGFILFLLIFYKAITPGNSPATDADPRLPRRNGRPD